MRRRGDPALRPPIPEWVLLEREPQDGWPDTFAWLDAHGYDVFELTDAQVALRMGRLS